MNELLLQRAVRESEERQFDALFLRSIGIVPLDDNEIPKEDDHPCQQ
jgi:hypothetical protein